MKEKKNKAKESVQILSFPEVRVALLEQSIGHINETLIRFEKRFDSIESRFDKVDDKFDKMDQKFEAKFDKLESKLDKHFYWTLGALVCMASVMAHGFHWI
jgi:uncharacterized coiled-coil protein SlyX